MMLMMMMMAHHLNKPCVQSPEHACGSITCTLLCCQRLWNATCHGCRFSSHSGVIILDHLPIRLPFADRGVERSETQQNPKLDCCYGIPYYALLCIMNSKCQPRLGDLTMHTVDSPDSLALIYQAIGETIAKSRQTLVICFMRLSNQLI